MLILFAGTNDGWGNYVINGTKKKPRNHEKIKVLKGDITLGDHITNHPNYRQNAYSIILSFKGKPSIETMNQVLTEFEQFFMHGFEDYEYHFDAVLHMDTDDYHIHIRIPKLNLYTGTQLQLYFDKKDRHRVNLIRNLIDMKYNLESPQNNRQLIQEERDFHLEKWQQKNQQKSKKTSRLTINNFIRELHQASLINGLSDIKQVLENVKFEIVHMGYDYSKDFYYITLKNESGKIRLIGDIYGKPFWKYSRADREEQIANNQQFRGSYEYSKEEYTRVSNELKYALKKRTKEINARYTKPRERAAKRLDNLQQKNKKNIICKTKPFKHERATTSHANSRNTSSYTTGSTHSELSIQRTKNTEKLAHSEPIQAKTKKWKVYSYTIERSKLLKKKQYILLKTGGLNGRINKNIIREDSKIGEERAGTHRFAASGQEVLYRKAHLNMSRMGEARISRKRYRKKIDSIGEQCEKIKQQFKSNISTINRIIRNITKETSNTGVSLNNQREIITTDYVDELLEYGRQQF